eukprot:CAMPEP_0113461282 /NCGR_PEP_ID=MMETSP0014_2-20120614/11455_1 /TAXON_ID=2857 /ORGANISM="Nitzschia sp." /LENGTH=1479 /DNA_ID=CAMNT_0000353027 /DNA_START=174 /DNA_END=4613 /DNA_ORIENTATION=- /assembly_acc=CAM_ASM_000159
MWRSYPQAQEQEGGDKMTSQSNNDNEDKEAAKKKTEITTATASLTMQAEGKSKDPVDLKEDVEGIKQAPSPPLSPRQNKDNTVDLTDLLSDTDDDEEEEEEEDQDRPSQKEDEKTQEDKQLAVNQQAAAKDSESQRKKLLYLPSASRSKRVPIKASEAVRNKGFRHLKRDRWYDFSAKRHPMSMFGFSRPRGLPKSIERGKKKTLLRDPEEDIEVGNDDSSPSDPSSITMRSNNDTDLQDQKVPASGNKPNDDKKAGTPSKFPPVTARPTVHEVDTRTTSSVAAAQLPTADSPKPPSSSLGVAAPTSAADKTSTAKAGGLDALARSLSCPQSVLAIDPEFLEGLDEVSLSEVPTSHPQWCNFELCFPPVPSVSDQAIADNKEKLKGACGTASHVAVRIKCSCCGLIYGHTKDNILRFALEDNLIADLAPFYVESDDGSHYFCFLRSPRRLNELKAPKYKKLVSHVRSHLDHCEMTNVVFRSGGPTPKKVPRLVVAKMLIPSNIDYGILTQTSEMASICGIDLVPAPREIEGIPKKNSLSMVTEYYFQWNQIRRPQSGTGPTWIYTTTNQNNAFVCSMARFWFERRCQILPQQQHLSRPPWLTPWMGGCSDEDDPRTCYSKFPPGKIFKGGKASYRQGSDMYLSLRDNMRLLGLSTVQLNPTFPHTGTAHTAGSTYPGQPHAKTGQYPHQPYSSTCIGHHPTKPSLQYGPSNTETGNHLSSQVLTLSSPRRTECDSRYSPVSKSREEGTTESSKDYSSDLSTDELKRRLERSRKFDIHNEKTKKMEEEIQSRENHQKSSVSSSPDTTSKVLKAASPTSVLDRSVVGSRVAKKFVDEKTYFGTVKSFSSTRRLWFIVYDDGDREEMDADELFSALELFQKQDEDLDLSLKANVSLGGREKNLPSEQDVETPKEDLFSSIPDEAFGSLDPFASQKRMNNTQDLAGMEGDASTLSGKTCNAVMEDEKLSVESSRHRKKFFFLGPSRFLKRKAGALYSTAASSLRKLGESVPTKHSDSNDSDACKPIPSTDVELPEKTQEDVYESYPDEDIVVGNSNANEKPSDIAVETVPPPPAKKTKTTTTTTTGLEVHPLAPVTQESPSSTSTGKDESNEETPTVDDTVAANDVVNVTQNTNSDSDSIVLPDKERNSTAECNENENDDNDIDIDTIKPEEYEGQVVDDFEVLRQEGEEEFDLISAEDHALEPYAENEMTVVDELGEGEEFEDGLADISIGTLVTAGAPLVVLACIFWGTGMVESSSSLFEALIRAPFQLALLGIGSQSRVAVAGYVLFMFYLAAQEISARTMYTFDGQFYVALGSLVLSVVTGTVFAGVVRIKPSRMWNGRYALPLISLLLTNSIASVALSMDSVCGSIASDEFLMGTDTGSFDPLLSTTLWDSAIHKGAGPTMSMLQKVGTMNVPVMMAGLILGGGGGGGETKATVPVAAKYCLLILFLSALCTFSSIFMTIGASIIMVAVDGDGCALRR